MAPRLQGAPSTANNFSIFLGPGLENVEGNVCKKVHNIFFTLGFPSIDQNRHIVDRTQAIIGGKRINWFYIFFVLMGGGTNGTV